jgi:lia operon protein LiaI
MSEKAGKVLIGLVFLVVGVLIILDMIGFGVGTILRLAIPVLLMMYGARKILASPSKGGKGWGIFVFLFGLLMLIGKLHLLFSTLLAIGILYYGMRLIRRPAPAMHLPGDGERMWAARFLRDDLVDRWEREWRNCRK